MTTARHHAEWLSLVESSGPFLSLPVLLRVFPQGLDLRDAARAAALRENYEEWLDRGQTVSAVHTTWICHVLGNLLEWPSDFIAEGQSIPAGLEASQPHFGETLRPDLVLRRPSGTADADTAPQILVVTYPPAQDLEKPVAGKVWKASPATRMTELLHASGVALGLVTNGEQWMIVYAPRGEASGFASWYSDLWMQEPATLRAFHSLLCLRRFFGVAAGETLAALYAESAKDQQDVTDQLGRQVRRAVEMLVQAFDQIDADSNRTLLAPVPEKEVYDAALTVMMRLVFLFSSEERGLLLLGQEMFDQHYAVSTLRELLRERADQHGEEVLERRHDAWSRLLSTFRAVHGGVQHEAMRLPAYGGSLFDPDRYPFLEGRDAGSRWHEVAAQPLAVNNRVVLHLLEALQLLRVRVPGGGPAEARRVSFRALDIEQIGHVYEGLLDHTARRAAETVLGLDGKKEPEIPLSKLEELAGITPDAAAEIVFSDARKVADDGSSAVDFPTRKVKYGEAPAPLLDFLKDETGRTPKALQKSLDAVIDDHALLLACGQDPRLARRVRPFAGLLRSDDFGRLAVIREGSVFVTAGTDRRSSGTHYTPRSLTEPIVKHTLDPLVYIGPAEGLPESEWKLKSPREILALKVCDMAMGSGAFLVQTCRFLAERLCEAWELAEREHAGAMLITPDGEFSAGSAGERLLPSDPAERVALARRYVADRCLYGVDINPMAVEMAKLSLWLITLQKDRPFTFLDHALKCGDSLLGVSSVQQIENFSLRPGDRQITFATTNLFRYVNEASAKRRALEELPSNDHTQIETKNRLHIEAEAAIAKVKAVADCLIALELRGLDGNTYEDQRTTEAEIVQMLMQHDANATLNSQTPTNNELSAHAREQLLGCHTFHWPVEFPEAFSHGGFDAFIGNPPFMGGSKITGALTTAYRDFLVKNLAQGRRGYADLCAYFLLKAWGLTHPEGAIGFIATNTIAQGDTLHVGLEHITTTEIRTTITRAVASLKWPGAANLEIAQVWLKRGIWQGPSILDGFTVDAIAPSLTVPSQSQGNPFRLASNAAYSFEGSKLIGMGFLLQPDEAIDLIEANPLNKNVVWPYLNGEDLNGNVDQSPSRWAINFFDWSEQQAQAYEQCFQIVRERVMPERQRRKPNGEYVLRKPLPQRYWQYAEKRPALYSMIRSMERVLVIARVSAHHFFEFSPVGQVFSDRLAVIAYSTYDKFAIFSSSIHDLWAHRPGATTEMSPESLKFEVAVG